MFLAMSNKSQQLLCLNYIGEVRPAELKRNRENLKSLLAELKPGFRLLANLSQLEFMAVDCAAEIGRNMELVDQAGVGMIVRVIPDPNKDIGMNILTLFHYPHHPQIITCETMTEAARHLSL
jgi:hypothetical protein